MFSKLMITLVSALSVCASPVVPRQQPGPPKTGTVGYVSIIALEGYSAGGLASNGQFVQGGQGSTDWVVTDVAGGLTFSTSAGQCGIVSSALVCGPGTPATTFAFSGNSDFATFAVSGQGWNFDEDTNTFVVVPLAPDQAALQFSPNVFN